MGIVQRQSLRNTVISYIGLAIGFANTTLVLPRLLAPAQIGLTTTLMGLATLGAQFAAFGFASTALRYFPYFRDPARNHSGFLALLLGGPLLGFAAVAGLMWAGKTALLSHYATDNALLGPNYGVAIGLMFCVLFISLQDAYLKAQFHSAFSSFVQEIGVRLLILAAAAAYAARWLTFEGFVLAYLGAYALATLALTAYLAAIGELHLRPSRAVLRVRPLRELLAYGGFALLSNISGTLLLTVDALMVGAKLNLTAAGVYAIAFNISTALTLPFRALYKTAYPLIAEYWKEGAMDKMAEFYRRTTRLNTLVGCYLALGIGLNLDFVYGLIQRPAYAVGTSTVLLLLLGRLADGITGVNGLIVVTSPRYRFDLIFNLSLTISIVVLNALLIPRLGLAGAALSNAIALVGLNGLRTWFVWRTYGLQPFDARIGRILAVAAVAGTAVWALPPISSLWVNLLLRGGLLTALYAGGLLLLNTGPEVAAGAALLRRKMGR